MTAWRFLTWPRMDSWRRSPSGLAVGSGRATSPSRPAAGSCWWRINTATLSRRYRCWMAPLPWAIPSPRWRCRAPRACNSSPEIEIELRRAADEGGPLGMLLRGRAQPHESELYGARRRAAQHAGRAPCFAHVPCGKRLDGRTLAAPRQHRDRPAAAAPGDLGAIEPG